MPHPLFSVEWAAAFERELGASAAFRNAGQRWVGALLLEVEEPAPGGAPGAALFLDLAYGSPRYVRPALDDDARKASHALVAPLAVWRALLEGDLDPKRALLGGQLRLGRGSLFSLLPHVAAAQALLACAREVPTEFRPPRA